MGGFDTGQAKDTTLIKTTDELGNKLEALKDSINELNTSTSRANNVMILLTVGIFLLTIVSVVLVFR